MSGALTDRIGCTLTDDACWLRIEAPAAASSLRVLDMQAITDCLRATAGPVVLAGSATLFSGGADRADMLGRPRESAIALFDLLDAVLAHDAPVIGVARGLAVGAGALLLAATHRIHATPDAVWRLPEVKLGVPPFSAVALMEGRVAPAVLTAAVYDGMAVNAQAWADGRFDDPVAATEQWLSLERRPGEWRAAADTHHFQARPRRLRLARARRASLDYLDAMLSPASG
ncbi:MAG: enoyl-CoA hydratase/isomerase family protein [Sphingobium sp.]|uniref:enoyl-CoA hydratase/isomerase family protein n=1 Tax=Sphingobium sp. TaxID=1912891 RepID=UPI002E23CB52